MDRTKLLTLALAAVVAVFAAACQNQPGNANTTANAGSGPGHDMANMPGHDMVNMNGHDMGNMAGPMTSAPGAAEQPYDLQFIDSMIHHHEGAIQMANMVIGKTKRPEVKAFAQRIIEDQTKEIGQMKQWREQWYAGKPSALNMALPGMEGGTKMMNSEHMKEMDEMKPDHFDGHFTTMMIAHHEGAVTMAKDALQKAEHSEIKQLSEKIISAQEAEIKQMRAWKEQWKE